MSGNKYIYTMMYYVSLGSNQGNRLAALKKAVRALEEQYGGIQKSFIYETPAWGYTSEYTYYNAVIRFETKEQPLAVLDSLLKLESQMGRERLSEGYSDRLIDLDIILIDDLIIETTKLEVPHPRMHMRSFVLQPLLDLANPKHPKLQKHIKQCLEAIIKEDTIYRIDEQL